LNGLVVKLYFVDRGCFLRNVVEFGRGLLSFGSYWSGEYDQWGL